MGPCRWIHLCAVILGNAYASNRIPTETLPVLFESSVPITIAHKDIVPFCRVTKASTRPPGRVFPLRSATYSSMIMVWVPRPAGDKGKARRLDGHETQPGYRKGVKGTLHGGSVKTELRSKTSAEART